MRRIRSKRIILGVFSTDNQICHRSNKQSWDRKDSFDCEELPCREVSHEELGDQFLEKNWFLYMLRATDMFILHCSQYTVLHVKVVSMISVIFCWLLMAQWSADGAGSVLLYQEASITFSGCQSFNTKSGYSFVSISEFGVFTYQQRNLSVGHRSENWLWKMWELESSAI